MKAALMIGRTEASVGRNSALGAALSVGCAVRTERDAARGDLLTPVELTSVRRAHSLLEVPS